MSPLMHTQSPGPGPSSLWGLSGSLEPWLTSQPDLYLSVIVCPAVDSVCPHGSGSAPHRQGGLSLSTRVPYGCARLSAI